MTRSFRPLVMVVLAALLVTLPASVAQAAPTAQRFFVENQLDPEASAQYSAQCGYPLEVTITGTYQVMVRTNQSGVTRELIVQSLLFTFTNLATGESLTVRNAYQTLVTFTPEDGTIDVIGRAMGLNFLYLQPDGTWASAGKRTVLATLFLDAQGNVVGADVRLDTRTQNLVGLGGLVCPALAT